MKNSGLVILALILVTVFASCSKDWNTYTRLYAVNTTADTFQILVEYPDFPDDNYLRRVAPSGKNILVSTYYTPDETKPGVRNMNLWVFNESDSSIMKLSNCEPESLSEDNYNAFVDEETTGYSKPDPNFAETVIVLRIEPGLKTGMYWDLPLADSLFDL